MLILSRKCGESLLINGQIEVRITEISGDKVKIGIDAPKDFVILRKELCQTVESNKEAACRMVTPDMLKFISELK